MIDYERLQSCMSGLVGFQNSDRNCIEDFGTPTGSTTGQYVTDEPGITATFMQKAKPKDYATLEEYTLSVIRSSQNDVLTEVVARHKDLTGARTLLQNINLTTGRDYRFTDQVTKQQRFVGIEIVPKESYTLQAIIKRIGVQFSQHNPTLTLYLFETSNETAISTFQLTGHNRINSLQWFEQVLAMPYKSFTGGTGQKYWLGYFEDDLTGNAVNTRLYTGCGGCGGEARRRDAAWRDMFGKYATIQGVSFPAAALSGTALPDLLQAQYSDQTFGLHAQLYIECDITDILCDNAAIFAPMLKKKMAGKIFWDYYNNANVGRDADISRDRALTNYTRVKEDYDLLLKTTQMDLTNLDEYCSPCSTRELYSANMY